MNIELENKIRAISSKYSSDGFSIVGVAGSYARDEETSLSDLDLVYEITNPADFLSRYNGFSVFSKIAEIKKDIESEVNLSVDLIALSSLNEIGRKYILEDLQIVS